MSLAIVKAKVRIWETNTDEFDINKGVKQGDTICPTPLNRPIESIIGRATLNSNMVQHQTQLVA